MWHLENSQISLILSFYIFPKYHMPLISVWYFIANLEKPTCVVDSFCSDSKFSFLVPMITIIYNIYLKSDNLV